MCPVWLCGSVTGAGELLLCCVVTKGARQIKQTLVQDKYPGLPVDAVRMGQPPTPSIHRTPSAKRLIFPHFLSASQIARMIN